MLDLTQDIRFGFRMLAKTPRVTIVAALTLALAIGANVAIFSVIYPVLLRPLPYPNPERLVALYEVKGGQWGFSSPGNFQDWRKLNHSFDDLIAWTTWFYPLTGTSEPEEIRIAQSTANFFASFGISPYLGRTYIREEEQFGRNHVAVLSYSLWQRRFGGDRNVLGRSITLNDNSYQIIGVLPADFHFTTPFSSSEYLIWTPFAFAPADLDRANRSIWVLGRLKPGVDIRHAQADLDIVAKQLAQQYGDTNSGWGVQVVSLQRDLGRFVRDGFSLMAAAVWVVLLIACGNVANLMLARSLMRQKEISIRIALGASRLRIFRQLLVESILLSLAGGVLGLGVAFALLRFLTSRLPVSPPIPHVEQIGIDFPVLGFTLVVSLLVGVLVALALAIKATTTPPNKGLAENARGSTAGEHSGYLSSIFLVSEVALSLTMLAITVLLIQSLVRLLRVNPGFSFDNVLTMRVSLPKSKYPGAQQISTFYKQALEHIGTLPQVYSAGAVNFLPLTFGLPVPFYIEGRPAPGPGEEPRAQYEIVSPGYFRTMGIPLLKGRYLTEQDTENTAGVAVVSAGMARQFWPKQDPIGKAIRPVFPGSNNAWDPIYTGKWLPVVGIVGDVRHSSLAGEPGPEMYLSFKQTPSPLMYLVAHTASSPEAVAASIQNKIWEVDKTQPVADVKSMQELVAASIAQPRFNAFLIEILASLALLLAALGIYGVISSWVAERTREIGIRMALGAQRDQVLRMVLGRGLKLTLIGLVIGVGFSLTLSRVLSSLLFGVKLASAPPFIVASVLLLLVGQLACYGPAKRATDIDPMIAARHE